MGNCIRGRNDINDHHPNVFRVSNIDEEGSNAGRHGKPGHLELTDSAVLVLHQRNAEPVRWPLKSLRRYGAEGNVFSFESGRKCMTGAGIYAFRYSQLSILEAAFQ